MKVIQIGVFLNADSEPPPMTYYVGCSVKMPPWRVTGTELFWSRDRLIKHEFDC